jgi:hypothetical protein
LSRHSKLGVEIKANKWSVNIKEAKASRIFAAHISYFFAGLRFLISNLHFFTGQKQPKGGSSEVRRWKSVVKGQD